MRCDGTCRSRKPGITTTNRPVAERTSNSAESQFAETDSTTPSTSTHWPSAPPDMMRSYDGSCPPGTLRLPVTVMEGSVMMGAKPPGAATPRTETRSPVSSTGTRPRSEEHTSELQSRGQLVCRLLLEK